MDFSTFGMSSFERALLGRDHPTLASCLSRVKSPRSRNDRKYRNALYRQQRKLSKLTPDARKSLEQNPLAHGLPRAYKIRFSDTEPTAKGMKDLEGARVIFAQFGRNGAEALLNNHQVPAKDVSWNAALNSYYVNTLVPLETGEFVNVVLSISFEGSQAAGSMSIGASSFNINLDDDPVWYDCQVSSNPAASSSEGGTKLVWYPEREDWKKATWEDTMEFGYRTVVEHDEDLDRDNAFVENYFADTLTDPSTRFDLSKDIYDEYSSSLDADSVMTTTVFSSASAPNPPEERKQSPVKSVFPIKLALQFANAGSTFTGAFMSGAGLIPEVYGVIGVAKPDTFSLFDVIHRHRGSLPLVNLSPFEETSVSQDAASIEGPKTGARTIPAGTDLNAKKLTNVSAMTEDKNDPTGWRDVAASRAMNDFHDIILYFMDEDLHKTFVSTTPTILPAAVKAIAEDNITDNKAFYKTLQVPYLAAWLGRSDLDQGTNVNAARAEKLLQSIPADSLVYKSQTAKLYEFRFLEMFPDVSYYLEDQQDPAKQGDYNHKIDVITQRLKDKIDTDSKDIGGTNPKLQEDLQHAMADLDYLAKWAKEKRLFWAYMLLYEVETTVMSQWLGYFTGGKLGSSLGMRMKALNTMFGVLEDNQVTDDGPNFMQYFNERMQLFQLTVVVPQMVAVEGCLKQFDAILTKLLSEYWNTHKQSGDPVIRQQAEDCLELYQDDELRKKMYQPFVQAQKLGAKAPTADHVMNVWSTTVKGSSWGIKLGDRLDRFLGIIQTFTDVVMMFIPIFAGSLGDMSPEDLAGWIASVVDFGASMLSIFASGVIKLGLFWAKVAGLGNSLKVILGFAEVMEKLLPKAARNISRAITGFFVRTVAQSAEAGAESLTFLQTVFGRNLGKIMSGVFGIILAIVTIVLTAIDLASETSGMMIASDIMMIMSASITILGTIAGWVVAAVGAAATGAVAATIIPALTLCAAWAGPLAAVFAIIGFIIFMLWSLFNRPPNPFDVFVEERCKPAGLYMAHLAIDYFQPIYPSATHKVGLMGVSMRTALLSDTTLATGSDIVYTRLNYDSAAAGNEPSPAQLGYANKLEYSNHDVWAITTDANGNTTIATRRYSADGKTSQVWYLAVNDAATEVITLELPSKEDDEEGYKAGLQRCYWDVTVQADPTLASNDREDPDYRKPLSMLCSLTHKSKTLAYDYGLGILVLANDTSSKKYAICWMLELQPIAPTILSYGHNPWTLGCDETDLRNFPTFVPSETSGGLEWSISAPLPTNLVFEKASGTDEDEDGPIEGSMRLEPGKSASVMEGKKWTVTVKLTGLPGGMEIAKSCEVEITVEDPSLGLLFE